jgi:hypothetical protein
MGAAHLMTGYKEGLPGLIKQSAAEAIWVKCMIHTYIYVHALHSVDPKLVKMTVGYGISHTPTKIHIPYN